MKSRKDMTVCVAYPYSSQQSSRFAHSLLFLGMADAHGRGRLATHDFNSSGANITNARNEIIEAFLKTDTDYLWFIDTDMVFEPDLVERLIEQAHPVKRPIVGALCFSLQKGMQARPTIYIARPDGHMGVIWDYPPDTLTEVDATGFGCVLIHRSVFEKMVGKYEGAYPFCRETETVGKPVGEDITFFVRARALGFPVYVDTRIKVGHEKTFVVDENMYLAQRKAKLLEPPAVPTLVVIASRNRRDELAELVASLGDAAVIVMDNGYEPPIQGGVPCAGWPLHRMWNHGLELAEELAGKQGFKAWNVAILNDDLRVEPDLLSRLDHGLRSNDNIWVSYPDQRGVVPQGQIQQFENPHLAGQTMTGYAFMLRGESGLRFDEQFSFWYGDSDIEKQVRAQDKHVVAVGGCQVEHLHPMESSRSPERVAQIRDDEKKFAAKWDLDPDSLFLAQHPEFGQ